MSFWMVRDAKKSDDEFLNTVDNKTPQEIIVMGKEIYQQRKEAGFSEYQQYKTWIICRVFVLVVCWKTH